MGSDLRRDTPAPDNGSGVSALEETGESGGRLFDGEGAVLRLRGWVGRRARRGRFVDGRLWAGRRGQTFAGL